jgi:hypothetical protein
LSDDSVDLAEIGVGLGAVVSEVPLAMERELAVDYRN